MTGHGVARPSPTGSSEMTTISVYFERERRKINGKKKSFQREIIVSAAQEAIAGLMTGTTTLVYIFRLEHPSMRDASISSFGMAMQYWRI